MKPTPLALALWRTAVALIASTMMAAIVAFAITDGAAGEPQSEAVPAVRNAESVR